MANKKPTPAELRAEAERIEAAELLAERRATADKIPTCECGSRVFSIDAWTTATGPISFEDDEEHGDWDGDDITEGEHTDCYSGATCAECGEDARRVLERHGWTFYASPEPMERLDVSDPEPNAEEEAERYARQVGAELDAAADQPPSDR